jgi:ABC-type uncharacterized transport system YnjBCD ATPase subunit
VKRLELLKQMSFGSQIAEEEGGALAGDFVETNQWQKIANGEIDIVRGEKGAGKSAIYTLLTTRVDDFFDKGILLVPRHNDYDWSISSQSRMGMCLGSTRSWMLRATPG